MFKHDFEKTIGRPLQLNEPLAKFTTIGIGGPAEYFFTVTSATELTDSIRLAHEHSLPVTIIGGGSNLVIADSGLKGLVLRVQIKTFDILTTLSDVTPQFHSLVELNPRLEQFKERSPYQADWLTPSFSTSDEVTLVRIGAGWKMNDLILHCLKLGLTGLEWFGGIPGSLGGAVYMNMHGGTFFWSQFVHSVRVLTNTGADKVYSASEMKFDYDYSVLHETREVIIDAMVLLFKGNTDQAKKIFQYWSAKKIQNQPQRSAGCIFQNLTPEQKIQANLPTSSIGYMIDQVLGLKGKQVGGAKISPTHAAFVENAGGATAKDVLNLIQFIEEAVQTRFGLTLKREVEFIG